MTDRRRVRMTGPDDAAGVRRDPAVQLIVDRLGLQHPLFPALMRDMAVLRRHGVEITSGLVEAAIVRLEEHAADPPPRRAQPAPKRVSAGRFAGIRTTGAVVYYMRVGNRVKIGTTSNLELRLKTMNPEELLAIEDGGHDLERHRHAQFKALRTEGEWFRHEGALVDHIATLKQV